MGLEFMGFDDLIRRIQGARKEHIGKKLADLAPDELARWESINLREDDLRKKLESLSIDLEDINVQRKKWWREVTQRYKIDCNVKVVDNQLFEIIVEETKE